MPASPIARLRRLCLALPEAHEVIAWGEPTFRVRNRMFATFANGRTHHGKGRHAVWCKAAPGNQLLMVTADPLHVFVPPYVGPSGWIGMYLDKDTDWKRIAEVTADAYRLVAPKSLLRVLDEGRVSTRQAAKGKPI